MRAQDHELFRQFPQMGRREISVGQVPVPYRTFDGYGVFIGGTADLQSISHLLNNEQVTPMQTTDGRALLGIWVVDFTQASLGPHKELQFSILVSHAPTAAIESHPLTILKALFINPDARMFCYGLWNDTETAVAYNRELLGLPARDMLGSIGREEGRLTFHFRDNAGQMLFEGDLAAARRTSPRVGWSLLRLMGLRETMRSLRQPYLGAKVVNPVSEKFTANLDAQSYLAADTPVVQLFDDSRDKIAFGEKYSSLFDFQPQFLEHFAPFRFVYLEPGKTW